MTGEHKAQLVQEALHAGVVLTVIIAVTVLLVLHVGLSPDIAGNVYVGALGYAGGRAGAVSFRAPRRSTDPADKTGGP